jgi:hypothetical protein
MCKKIKPNSWNWMAFKGQIIISYMRSVSAKAMTKYIRFLVENILITLLSTEVIEALKGLA